MRYREEPARVKALARGLIAAYGKGAGAVALAIAATLIDNGLLDYAQIWQQVATLIGGGSG
ncbi:MAG TPA: hypothetical protein VGL83_19000 [Stellaceae bacterium]|jgi:hypothetical protein